VASGTAEANGLAEADSGGADSGGADDGSGDEMAATLGVKVLAAGVGAGSLAHPTSDIMTRSAARHRLARRTVTARPYHPTARTVLDAHRVNSRANGWLSHLPT